MPLKKFMMIFIPYLIVYIVYLIYEVTIANNIDVKGGWPLALIFIALCQALVSIVTPAVKSVQLNLGDFNYAA